MPGGVWNVGISKSTTTTPVAVLIQEEIKLLLLSVDISPH